MIDESSRHASFPSTHWSEISRIYASDPLAALEAINGWLARYWRPLYAFFRSKGRQPHDAHDLTQGLLLRIVEKENLRQIEPGTNLRCWLLATARNFNIDEHRRANTQTRRPEGGVAFLEEMKGSSGDDLPLYSLDDPVKAYKASWCREVLARAFEAVAAACAAKGRQQHLAIFWSYYVGQGDAAPAEETVVKKTWDDVAQEFGLSSGKEASHRADWVRRQFVSWLRKEIRGYVRDDDDVDGELRDLMGG